MIGPPADGQLSYDRSIFDVRRLFISNDDIAGKTIASLNLEQRFNLLITRVQRGDMDLLATGDTVLELGDRILMVAHGLSALAIDGLSCFSPTRPPHNPVFR